LIGVLEIFGCCPGDIDWCPGDIKLSSWRYLFAFFRHLVVGLEIFDWCPGEN